MKKIFILFLFFHLFFLTKTHKIINEIIENRLIKYQLKEQETRNYKFIANLNGKYVFIFSHYVRISDIKGKVDEDLTNYDKKFGLISRIYFQDFDKGDYIKVFYPISPLKKSEDLYIRMEKIYRNSRIKVFSEYQELMHTLEFPDYSYQTYLFFINSENNYQSNEFYFTGLIHSGKFKLSYKRVNTINEKELLFENFKEFKLDSYIKLLISDINIIKIQCIYSGILSFFYQPILSYHSNFGNFLTIFQNKTLFYYDKYLQYDNFKYYIQMFNLFGCSKINLTEFGSIDYSNTCGNFYTSYTINDPPISNNYIIRLSNDGITSGLFSIINKGEIGEETLILKEKQALSIDCKQRIIIPFENEKDKKYIKIKCSSPKFSWTYEFSHINNTNFLARPCSSTENIVNNNFVIIYNPYLLGEKKKNLYWYLVLKQPYNTQCIKLTEKIAFKYEYIKEIPGEKKNMKRNYYINLIIKLLIGLGIILVIIEIVNYIYNKNKNDNKTNKRLINNSKKKRKRRKLEFV